MDLSSGIQKVSISQPPSGRGVPCLRCRGMCTGFEPHSWRKICKSCKCSQEDHSPNSDAEDDRKIGRLLSDSKYSSLTARVKGGDGVRIYKRNRMIITNPIVSRKDPTFDTVTYEWAPPGLTQKLVGLHLSLSLSLSLSRLHPYRGLHPPTCEVLTQPEPKRLKMITVRRRKAARKETESCMCTRALERTLLPPHFTTILPI